MDNFLEGIKQAEEGLVIKTTHEYIGSRKIAPATPLTFKKFRTSIFFKLLGLSLPVGLLVVAIFFTFQPRSLTNTEIGGVFVGYAASFFFGANFIRQDFLDKRRNIKIRVDNSGISIDDTLYKWSNIYETAIMTKVGGKSSHFVIALDNMSTYESYDLTNFASLNPFGFGMTLAKYIEYFKPAKSQS